MRLPDELLECVVFLVTTERGEDPATEGWCRGTAFFVAVEGVAYLVTAKHCISKVIEKDLDLYVRINRRSGQSEDVRIATGWGVFEDPSVDLAVVPFQPDHSVYQYRMLDSSMLATFERIREHKIGIGDEAAIVGLFTRRTGKQRNIPIVRFGNIAAMPSEQIPDTKTGLPFHAYLLEARSFGGLSGSPVFAYLGPARVAPDKTVNVAQQFLFLIGVVRGHWEHDEPLPFASSFRDELDKINWGIATVTPTTYLAEMLDAEEFVKQREKKKLQREALDAPVSDFADDDKLERPFTKEDFESALKKASRKITPTK